MKILLGYSHYPYPTDISQLIETRLGRLRAAGIDIDGFVLTLNPPGPRLSWPQLDEKWHRQDAELLEMYARLEQKLEGYDIFVNWNGINLHPEFVSKLKRTFNIYACFDDPESSADLSRPVAAAYDLAMVGNIAEVETYKSWGVKHAKFWPMGFWQDEYDPKLTKEAILSGERSVDITMLCERLSPWRQQRLDQFAAAFPAGEYYGQGWPKGFLPEASKIPLYQKTKIGPNFHNSTGPINYRTYMLPANGVMQICDNKSHLGKIFELDKEVAGFDNVEEAIELTRYYLAHDQERRQIAAAGWERALRDYNEVAIFKMIEQNTREVLRIEQDRLLGKFGKFSNLWGKHLTKA